jgi:arylsulfatase A-like enzyme
MKKQPNIIWIFSDQQPAFSLACNGDPNARTPHLDRMSASGFNFRNAVAGFPLCCPFRGSLLTGRYPHNCVPAHQDPLPPEMSTAADLFNAAGYDTAYFGKWHLDGVKEWQHPRACKQFIPPERRGRFNRWIGYENNNMQYDTHVHGHMSPGVEVPHYKLPGYEVDELTTLLCDYLRERGAEPDKPFFTILSVQPPHNPYIAPAEYHAKYNPQSIKLRPNVAHNPETENNARHDLAGMYGMVENIDHNIGRVLDTLRAANLEEDTWVFFFSDHGDMHGSHGQWLKVTPYHEATNIPFVVWTNGNYRSLEHMTSGRPPFPINTPDILPTTLGLCGLASPDYIEGFDYSSIFRGKRPDNPPASAFLQSVVPTRHGNSTDRPYRGVLTLDNWKYVCTERDDWLLFDLNTDPFEECNLVFNNKYKDKRAELRKMTAEWIAKTSDPFKMP